MFITKYFYQEFGQADHGKTVEILKKKYPQWTIKILGIYVMSNLIIFYNSIFSILDDEY